MKIPFNRFLLFAVCTVGFLSACKKEESFELPGNPNVVAVNANKVSKLYYKYTVAFPAYTDSTTYYLTYDASDRLTIAADSAVPANRQVFTYSNGSYTWDDINLGYTDHHINFLNTSLLVDSTYYDASGLIITERYLYNNSNKLIKEKLYDNGGGTLQLSHTVDHTYDASGNMIQSVESTGTTTAREYYPNLNNVYMGEVYEPVRARNLEKKRIITSTTGTEIVNTTYTYDSQNRVVTQSSISSTGDTEFFKYTYFN